MNKLLSLTFALGIITVPSAQAMPIERLVQSQDAQVIQVGYRCGFGVRLDTNGNCSPVYRGYYQGYHRGYYAGYRRGYYRGYRHAHYDFPYVYLSGRNDPIVVDKGFCGLGAYLSCALGGCWRLCY